MAYTRKKTSANYNNRRFLNEDCQLSAAFEKFEGRWTGQIIFCIHFGLNRFGYIKNQLPNVSDQILGLRLRQLVENKLIVKHDSGSEKVYELTEKGKSLIPILEQLSQWHAKR